MHITTKTTGPRPLHGHAPASHPRGSGLYVLDSYGGTGWQWMHGARRVVMPRDKGIVKFIVLSAFFLLLGAGETNLTQLHLPGI